MMEYNLAINGLKQQKLVLEKEVSVLTIERDKIHQDISGLRKVETDLNLQIQKSLTTKNLLEVDIKLIEKQKQELEKNMASFLEKYNLELQEIQSELHIKQKELEKFNSIQLYDKNLENIKTKQERIENQHILDTLKREIQNIKTEQQNRENSINNKIQEELIILEKIEQEKGFIREEKQKLSLVQNQINKHCKDHNLPFLKLKYGKNKKGTTI